MAAQDRFPIAGIGASAGGLEALKGLFRAMPTDTGMAFALVTHLARGHASSLVEILGRYIKMPVKTAVNGAELNFAVKFAHLRRICGATMRRMSWRIAVAGVPRRSVPAGTQSAASREARW